MKILSMDTSNQSLSVALWEDGHVLAESILNIKKNHSLTLMPEIDRLLQSVGWVPKDLTRIVTSVGPGSYTGIRIAVTTAKTLAYALNIELVGVSTLEVLACNVLSIHGLAIPMIDARRNNVYVGVFNTDGINVLQPMEDRHISVEQFLNELAKWGNEQLYFLGDSFRFKEEILAHFPHAEIMEDEYQNIPHAAILAKLGAEKTPSDVHNFLPNYLKRVEAEEKWLEKNGQKGTFEDENYVEKI
ncbi:tRNA threonylcarbamoyl adenosine modification protein YeaZ [Pilibacter termitis]|uniref:tRNA threonylcarbamoyl adenosine modification protein YeaZ n=1 Tax=Pilibacter termitis TaxID=263852 RepID=A0A1T4KP82_9ENTE|nr:tRNA (adenosine(37)-N6)-threonylcarbamoyltransferase complex dimerization subunit type 1 TsaB [Pilibacter termitis]SJZ44225.1 tRNA threonylcarbamoyl adenosine modification protein YeaZ [Pilibacter termitis]